jgi:hypothetical protein
MPKTNAQYFEEKGMKPSDFQPSDLVTRMMMFASNNFAVVNRETGEPIPTTFSAGYFKGKTNAVHHAQQVNGVLVDGSAVTKNIDGDTDEAREQVKSYEAA